MMTGIGEKLAISAGMKATDGVVKLFFSSQIETLKKKLKNRYIESQISSENIEDIFQGYFSSLYKKCSMIDTVVFPQKKIFLEDIYIPMKLSEYYFQYDYSYDDKYLIHAIHDDLKNNILLIDTAGMGKSTFCKYLVLKIMQNTSHSKIPIFIELRKITQEATLVSHIVKEINLGYKDVLTLEMLYKLMEDSSFLFILDGFDEIDYESLNRIGKEISDLTTDFSNNLFILTSRNQSYIPSLYNSVTLHFQPLNEEQIKSLLLKYDASVNIDVGTNLIKHENFKKLNFDLFDTPLMVNLLYKTFGYTGTIDSDIVIFYDEMFNALYKGHDLTKAGFSRPMKSNLDIKDFRHLFESFCFISLFENNVYFKNEIEVIATIKKASILSSIEISEYHAFYDDLLTNVPFLTRDGREYKFVHKTIIEFFAAEFLNYSEIKKELIEKIKKNNILNNYGKSFEFLYKINKFLYVREIGSEFLTEYIEYYNAQNKNMNIYLKTALFFLKDVYIQVVKSVADKSVGIKPAITLGCKQDRSFQLKYNKNVYDICLAFNIRKDFSYTPSDFFFEISIIDNKESLNDYNMQSILTTLELNSVYEITSKACEKLQNNEIILNLLMSIMVQNLNLNSLLSNKIFAICPDKCKHILDSSNNKVSILD